MLIKVNDTNNITFPQANDIYKVVKYVDNITFNYHHNELKRVSMDFVSRQKQYYEQAARYLSLIKKNREPTELAIHLFKLDKNELLINIVQLILKNKIFLHFYLNRDEAAVTDLLIEKYEFSLITAKRRLSTVKAWVKWCDIIIKENHMSIEVE
jgi:hypothetical protein